MSPRVLTDLATASALALAVVFGWAAVAKFRARATTVASFRGLGLPAPPVLASVVPLAEAGLAVGLVVAPAPSALAALALVLVFTIVIGRAIATRSTVACACFGGAAEDRPVSVVELVRNGGLGALAVVASGAGAGSALWPSVPAIVIVTVVVAAARIGLVALLR